MRGRHWARVERKGLAELAAVEGLGTLGCHLAPDVILRVYLLYQKGFLY
jgi:hypothetical protein